MAEDIAEIKKGSTDLSERYNVLSMSPEEVGEVFDANLGGAVIKGSMLPRIKTPSGGALAWELPTLEGKAYEESFEGIIIAWKVNRSYWLGKYTGGGEAPICHSADGVTGIGDPGGECSICPKSKWTETGEGEDNLPPECTNQRMLFVLREKTILPTILILPPTSIPEWEIYSMQLTSFQVPHWAVVTKFSLIGAVSGDGIEYAKLKLAVSTTLEDKEKSTIRKYTSLLKDLIGEETTRPDDYFVKEDTIGPEVNQEDIDKANKALDDIIDKQMEKGSELITKQKEKESALVPSLDSIDTFIGLEKPDYKQFWMACRALKIKRERVHKELGAETVKDVPKDVLDDYLKEKFEEFISLENKSC